MARFRLQGTHIFGAYRLKSGSVIVDTVGNAQPGDYVWTPLSSGTLSLEMVPIDASATSMKNASRFAGMQPRACISGAESIS